MSGGGLLIAAPLRLEALLIKSRSPRRCVQRTGMGRDRSIAAARTLRNSPGTALLVMGFCGGLDEVAEPGDVVVADEVHPPDEIISGVGQRRAAAIGCAGAEVLTAAFVSRGLSVRGGAIATVLRPAHGEERRVLRTRGAVAVDMESAYLASGAAGRPFATVRIVVDTPARELTRPWATLTGGARAALVLRRVAGAVDAVIHERGMHTVFDIYR